MTKTLEIGTAEKLLADWREAQAVVDTLLEFKETGGEHRLRMRTDGSETVIPGSLVDRLLSENGGYAAVLGAAIKRAEIKAEAARKAFLAECAGQAIAEEVKP